MNIMGICLQARNHSRLELRETLALLTMLYALLCAIDTTTIDEVVEGERGLLTHCSKVEADNILRNYGPKN